MDAVTHCPFCPLLSPPTCLAGMSRTIQLSVDVTKRMTHTHTEIQQGGRLLGPDSGIYLYKSPIFNFIFLYTQISACIC